MHNRRGQLCEEHRCADIYRCPREFGDGPDGTTRCNIQTNIVHTLATRDNAEGGAIRATVSRVEYDTDKKAQAKWRELYPDTEPAGLLAKVDVSRNPYGRAASLLASLRTPAVGPRLRRLLYRLHTGFLGGSRPGGARGPPMRFRRISRARRPGLRHAHRRAHDIGEYQQRWGPCLHMGAHKQSRVHGPNEGVQQGRIEPRRARSANPLVAIWPTMSTARTSICDTPSCIPMYRSGAAFASKSLCTLAAGETSANTAKEVVAKALALVSPSDLPEEQGLFVVQPPAKQWENLAASLDRCLVLADRPQGSIFVAWYAHTTTGRVSGVWVRPSKANADKEEAWERAIEWAAVDLGFCACPIFRVDILGANEGCRAGAAPMQGRRCRHNLGS